MFQTIDPKKLTSNVFSMLDDQWTLISAGEANHCNTMTASWGGLGVLFHKNVATIYVRPQRYTFEFLEQYPEFTLSFFDEGFRPQLRLLGSKSGRDTDKLADSGLTLAMAGETAPYFQEANLVLVCRKLYYHDLEPLNFIDPSLAEFYEKQDYHRMYIGEIIQALVK
jgi:flavin reductase (DIM6/NTAB) family NADH-FMN oxidoreductase RutF